jgi:hypothetical protein
MTTIPNVPTPATTDFGSIDRAIAELHRHRVRWAQVNISQRLAYLQTCLDRTLSASAASASGIGCVHNSYRFDRLQKSVVYAPFRIFPTPAWFSNHNHLSGMAQHLLKF